ncbi:MAG: HAMP domain-containing histidine kinase [Eubacterium sp.]|nr:HAMP domain-containing histidine kinase [Eubacterium sp.]
MNKKKKRKFITFKTTLGQKLTMFYMIIAVISFFFMQFRGFDYVYENTHREVQKTLSSTSSVLVNSHFASRSYSKSNLMNMTLHLQICAETANCRIIVMYDDGEILQDTSDINFKGALCPGNLDFLCSRTLSDFTMNGYLDSPSLCVIQRVAKESYSNGYLIFSVPNAKIKEKANDSFNTLMMTYYLIMMVLALVFMGIYVFLFLPLRKLRMGVKDFSIAKENKPIIIRSNDEYGELADTLNIIGRELSKFDEYQRKFISNISHDFRSPLTSIRGYVQAMADGVIPEDQMEKYLEIILFETDRLTKLTTNLLDLNNYDKDNIFLDQSDFDIHDYIKKTAGALEGTAEKKKIHFHLTFQEDTPLMVHGDAPKVQQVLHNLMDNAIKFSSEDSTIQVSTRSKGDKVFISVKDTGIGIPKEDQDKIFERFYKTDLSRGKDKLGTGLGLAICKEIIDAHKQTLGVISTEGVGSEFIFTLARVK